MMKKTLFALLMQFLLANSYAQNLLDKIPANASFILKIDAGKLSTLVPNEKFNDYKFIKENISKALQTSNENFDVQKIGLDLTKTAYVYYTIKDSCTALVSLLPIRDGAAFNKFMADNNKAADTKKTTINGINLTKLDDNTYITNNAQLAVISKVSYMHTKYYNDDIIYPPYLTTKDVPYYGKKPTAAQKEKIATIKKQNAKIRQQQDLALQTYYQKQEAFRKKEVEKARNIEQNIAASLFTNVIAANTTTTSIANNTNYTTVIEDAAPITFWYSGFNMTSNYMSLLYGHTMFRSPFTTIPLDYNDAENTSTENNSIYAGIAINFTKDQLQVTQKQFSPNKILNDKMLAIYANQPSEKITRLINPNALGYFNIATNTEASYNFYYDYYRKSNFMNLLGAEQAEIVDLVVDAIEIALDEKALSSVITGNIGLVLHGLAPRKVTYIATEYDNNYTPKQIVKTKEELSPDFTLAFETKREDFCNKVINVIRKTSARYSQDSVILARNGYYEIFLKDGELPFSNFYLGAKNGVLFFTTSKEILDNTLANKGYTLNPAIATALQQNSIYANFDLEAITKKILPEIKSDEAKEFTQYFADNVGVFESKNMAKNGILQSFTTLGIKGNHTNALDYIFNLLNYYDKFNSRETFVREVEVGDATKQTADAPAVSLDIPPPPPLPSEIEKASSAKKKKQTTIIKKKRK